MARGTSPVSCKGISQGVVRVKYRSLGGTSKGVEKVPNHPLDACMYRSEEGWEIRNRVQFECSGGRAAFARDGLSR